MQPDISFTVPFLIAGVAVRGSKTFPIVNPANGETLWNAASATLQDVDAAVAAASKALPAWRATKLSKRRDLILKVADVLQENTEQLVAAMKLETSADEGWCQFNIGTSIEMLKGVASRVSTLEGRIPESDDPDVTAMIVKDPYGVVLAIAPWNAPIVLGIRAIIFPLAAGNTVIFKSSELSPLTHYLVAEIFQKAGFPEGTVNLLCHLREDAPAITAALIAAPAVRKINFTGSTAIGRKIAALAGENLKPTTLELGGKASMIVFEDADIEKAARAGAFGAFHYAGQICMSCERVLVHRSISAAFTTALKVAVAEMYGEKQVLIQAASSRKVSSLLLGASKFGATLHPTPEQSENPNEHHNVILTGVTTDMDIWRTESFGPVVVVAEFEDEREAVEMANDTEYGLSSAVWTKDLVRGIRVARQIESGAVHINSATVHDEVSLPHGGIKNSGYGRFGGTWGLDEFMTTKTITFRV